MPPTGCSNGIRGRSLRPLATNTHTITNSSQKGSKTENSDDIDNIAGGGGKRKKTEPGVLDEEAILKVSRDEAKLRVLLGREATGIIGTRSDETVEVSTPSAERNEEQ